MKNQNGMSLVTLLVTIVVLLILAGVTIAMLSTSSNEKADDQTSYLNTENEIINRMSVAYSVVKSNADIKMATVEGYSPIGISPEGIDYGEELAKVVAKELGLSDTDIERDLSDEPVVDGKYHVIYNSEDHTITMLYGDEQFSQTVDSNGTYSNIESVITLTATDVVYSKYPQNVIK